ncbi:MAG: MFS transporter [Rhizobiaceae bacterium]
MAIRTVAALIAIAFLGSTLVTPLYAAYRHVFGFSEITLTLIYAAYVVGNLGALLFLGRLSDQVGRRPVALASLAAAFVSGLLFLFASGTAWLYAGRILSGLGVGLASGTGTAWLTELYGRGQKARATLAATCANFVGLTLGPLIGGLLSQYAPWPLHLCFVIYLLGLVAVALPTALAGETVRRRETGAFRLSLKPSLGVPPDLRIRFTAPAVTAFGTFALIGFYAALIPTILAQGFGLGNHAVGGAVVSELFLVAVLVMVATRRLASRTAMLGGLVLLLPSLALLVAAQFYTSMPLLIAGTALTGVAGALGYRGSLQVVNEIAPEGQRAEVVSSYMVACFVGNSIPVIGVGVMTTVWNALLASIVFAGFIGVFAVAAIIVGVRYIPKQPRSG